MTTLFGYAIGIFIAFLIAIVLIPIVILVGLYFFLLGNKKSLKVNTDRIVKFFTDLLDRFHGKSKKSDSKRSNQIEDAEFREIE